MFKRCGECHEKVPVTDDGLIATHNRPGEKEVECSGSGTRPIEPLGHVPQWDDVFALSDGPTWERCFLRKRDTAPAGELAL